MSDSAAQPRLRLDYEAWCVKREALGFCKCWTCYGRYADRIVRGEARIEL